MSLTTLVPAPKASAINTGLNSCPTSDLIRRYGFPRPHNSIDDECRAASATFWQGRMVTESVGPYSVTGHKEAVRLLRHSLAAVKAAKPELYRALSSAGMLCVRWVRGHRGVLSNHSLGLAIDFKIHGVLDPYGDGKCQVGLLELYKVMKRFGWYWGAEFRKEDAMHFEVSAQKVYEWIREGKF